LPIPALLDIVAPALPLAQAIGRWGNWFNQELFGRPTPLPWGLDVVVAYRPAGYEQYATFHPTFLYEMLWNLALVAALIAVERGSSCGPVDSSPATSAATQRAACGWRALLRWSIPSRVDPAARATDSRLERRGDLIERGREVESWPGLDAEFVVAPSEVLDEGVSSDDDGGGAVAFESAHRP